MQRKVKLLLTIILFIGFYFRFYNLMHDAPFFFNPDERNMAIAITQFRLPKNVLNIPSCFLREFSKRPSAEKIQEKTRDPECALNPHFFAYGQFPLYLSYLSDQAAKPAVSIFQKDKNSELGPDARLTDFSSAIYWLRFYSALTSTLTVLVLFLISNQLITSNLPRRQAGYSLVTAALAAFIPGLLQSAHFGTTESLLTFFFMSVIFLSIKLNQKITFKLLFLTSVSIGLAIGSKFTGIFLLFPPFLVLLLELLKSAIQKKKKFPVFFLGLTFPLFNFLKITFSGILILFLTLLIYALSSPYNFVEPENFRSAVFGYESDVATGKFEAFYTRQFVNTVPFLFQMEKIFPYVLGWPVFIAGTAGFLLIIFVLFKKIIITILPRSMKQKLRIKNIWDNHDPRFIILVSSFLVYLIPNSLLYAKWSRFMTPILPFFAIFSAILIFKFIKIFSRKSFLISRLSGIPLFAGLTSIFLILALIPGIAFMSVYTNEDSRVTASRWIYDNLPEQSYVLSETANVIDIPLGLSDYKTKPPRLSVISFDFYHLNENPELYPSLLNHLEKANYIFIPSRRIFKNHSLQPEKFKVTNKYYELLFSGRLGFEKVAEFASYPQINLGLTSIKFPDEDAEETYTVFDHPVVRIYKKVTPYTRNDYETMLNNEQ